MCSMSGIIMNQLTDNRGNRAKRDKSSILADVKNLLVVLYPAIYDMPKIERMEGAPAQMKHSCMEMIKYFSIAKECPEVRTAYIQHMIGEFGILTATFEIAIETGLFTTNKKLAVANLLERIKEGIVKWRNATRSKRQDQAEIISPSGETELSGSTNNL